MPPQHNKVELVGFCGSDFTHALSILTSDSKELNEEKKIKISKRIKMLVDNGHYFVFKKSSLHFIVTLDISSYIDLIKRRIAGATIVVAEFEKDRYYVPVDWKAEEKERYIEYVEASLQKYHATIKRLIQSGISFPRAHESAKCYLLCGNQITVDITFNFYDFVNFIRLSRSVNEQLEINNIADSMLNLVVSTNEFSETLKSFGLPTTNVEM